jgi:hypothetical protein
LFMFLLRVPETVGRDFKSLGIAKPLWRYSIISLEMEPWLGSPNWGDVCKIALFKSEANLDNVVVSMRLAKAHIPGCPLKLKEAARCILIQAKLQIKSRVLHTVYIKARKEHFVAFFEEINCASSAEFFRKAIGCHTNKMALGEVLSC